MTHEDPHHRSLAEHGGPEHDQGLPDATTIPEVADVEASLAPLVGYGETVEECGAGPGWWGHYRRPEYGAVQSFWLDE